MRMRNNISIMCAAVLFILSAGPAFAEGPLTGTEIVSHLAGKTFNGKAGENISFVKTYNTDGTFSISFPSDDSNTMSGTWRVVGDQYCQTRTDVEICYTIENYGAIYTAINPEGQVHTTFQAQ